MKQQMELTLLSEILPSHKLKNHCTPFEDVQIIEFGCQNGVSKLKELTLLNRSTHQIRERFPNYLNPEISGMYFSREEDILLLSCVDQY
jgi:hypothetical protein